MSDIADDALLERLAIAANVFQVGSFLMNMEQLQNEDLMKALDLQNLNYLDIILQNQNEILIQLKNISERLDKLEKI